MEAFSDGVLAIVITIMVLKLNAPKDLTLDAVKEVFPTFLAYILSFIYVGIYWANHHHLINMTDSANIFQCRIQHILPYACECSLQKFSYRS